MIYVLGIITGILLSNLGILTLIYFKIPVERKINQIVSQTKKKGEIIEPENEELASWINNLPDNEPTHE